VIVVKLMGGLGNQMFQYALGRRLAHERGVPLKLDLTWFSDAPNMSADTIREYALDGWRIHASIANAADLSSIPGRDGLLARLGFARSRAVREQGFGFDAEVLRVPSNAYLNGYWQSERYFKAIRDVLMRDFTLAAPPCSHVAQLLPQLRELRPTAIHVRRGDYAHNRVTNAFHGLCSIEYYKEAARRIAERIPEPAFLVFSDDLDWVKENLRLGWPTSYVQHDDACSPHQDMWVMSRCSHHIIANSSFSWWGAWLCPSDEKIVIAPKQWFRDPQIDTRDLIPEGWARI
jgi:Glycosyl transferase family 11